MKNILASLSLLLAACGQAVPRDVVTVRAYTDSRGDPTPHADSLGFTYLSDGDGAKFAAPGWNCLINPVLTNDPDDDRLTRVVLHELANVIILDTGVVPPYGPGWFAFDSDTIPPFTDIGPDEAAWFAAHGPYRVNVTDDWLRQPVAEALLRITLAAGREVFR